VNALNYKMAEEKKSPSAEVSEDKEKQNNEEVKEEKEEEKEEEKKEEKEKPKEEEKKDKPKEKKEDKEKEVEVPKQFKDIVEKIEKMSVVELADLVSVLEKRFNVSAVAPAATGGNGGGNNEEKTQVDVMLKETGDQKINVIKAIKEISGLGLKEAKALVDEAPSAVKKDVKREEAEEMKKKLEEVGATVALE